MKISIASFTQRGGRLSLNLKDILAREGHETSSYSIEKYACDGIERFEPDLKTWAGEHFGEDDAMIFIGASGIAVRSIAPYVKSKTTDPAVIVIDEMGQFVISLLSGHIGGSNELSTIIAKRIAATPVITTATDVNNTFAVDVFATKNNMFIDDMKKAMAVSVAVLNHEALGFESDFPVLGGLDPVFRGESPKLGVHVTLSEDTKPYEKTLHLIPRIVTIGVGCRRDKDFPTIEAHVLEALKQNNISMAAVEQLATIDLKKDEKGLISLCDKYGLKFTCYSSEELEAVEGEFTNSSFVGNITGVQNVCERAAVLGSGYGHLIQKKLADNGVTVAIAVKEWSVRFE